VALKMGKTLIDILSEFSTKYIRKTKEEKKTIEDILALPSEYNLRKYKKEDLTQKDRRELALECPLFMKGTLKKNGDTVRAWFRLMRDDGGKVPQKDIMLLRQFVKRSNLKRKFMLAGICADVYGDGYLLIKFLEKGGSEKLATPVDVGTEPIDVVMINPENITEMAYKKGDTTTLYYHYVNNSKGEDKLIHPDRILHIKTIELPFDSFGISKIDILRNIIISNADIDIATGDILKWFSHGIQVLTKEGMTKNERTKAIELLATHPNYFAFSEKYKLDVTKPESINPQYFYEWLEICIAAVLVMPKHVLTGVQVGRVTGAEIGYGDYYRDIKDTQDLVYTPLLNKLFNYLYNAYGREFEYNIEWETIYIDEMAEAELMQKRADAVSKLLSSNRVIITDKEAREIMSEGKIYLEPEIPLPEPDFPDRKPIPPSRPMNEDNIQEEIEMDLAIKKEKELGKKLLQEQEDLFKDDNNDNS